MASGLYTAAILTITSPQSANFDDYNPVTHVCPISSNYSNAIFGPMTDTAPVEESPTNRTGVIAGSWGTDLFDKILINYPLGSSLDVGSIVADKIVTFYIWNTYATDQTCTEFSIANDDGITTDGPTPNFTVHPFKDALYTLTITLTGPASIGTEYEWTFNELVTLSLTGTRLRLLPIKHDWAKKMTIKFNYKTTISRTKKFYEQRKPLSSKISREIQISELCTTPFIRNTLDSLANVVFGIPVIIEPITPVAGQGTLDLVTVINVQETLTPYYNLNNVNYLVAWNNALDQTEILSILSVGTTSITLAYASLKEWNLNDCTLYPMFMCMVSDCNIRNITDSVYETNLKVIEYLGTA